MLASEPYIIIAQQEWELDLGSNARNIAMEISKTNPVLYVNPALDVNTLLRQVRTAHGRKRLKLALGWGKNTTQVSDNVWVHTPSTLSLSINWLKQAWLFNSLNKINAAGYFKSLQKAIKKLGWSTNDCIIFNDSQMFVGRHAKRYLHPRWSFYYIRDNLIHHPYFKRHGSRIEPETIGDSDAIFANSAYLADYAKHYNIESQDIGQGCELEMYDSQKTYIEPDDMASIPHPRIGYVGFLTGERLDISLLEELAIRKKDWQWVLIGPEEIMFRQSKLHHLPNVHFLGAKKGDVLPAYLKHLDVCLNPQLVNELTIGNYPRKIDEYLAMGKPTVATNTPAMQMFLPYVHLANGTEEYIQVIDEALGASSKAKTEAAIVFAKSHTWQACIQKIFEKRNQLSYVEKPIRSKGPVKVPAIITSSSVH